MPLSFGLVQSFHVLQQNLSCHLFRQFPKLLNTQTPAIHETHVRVFPAVFFVLVHLGQCAVVLADVTGSILTQEEPAYPTTSFLARIGSHELLLHE